ncbi:MAG TPA: hypothetical protein VK666_21720 [Chryseolinea sp.]|nr:hypothetical protein [Chryseolinea sp.]
MSQIQKATEIIEKAKKEVNAVLKDSQFFHAQLEINALFDKILVRFQHMGGLLKGDDTGIHSFPPITSFMGELLTPVKMIESKDLNPTQHAKAVYLQKVERLYTELPTISPEGLLNSYTLPEDILVLRGVAKRAGVDEFETAELTTAFVEDIITAIQRKAKDEKAQKKIDDELSKQDPRKTKGVKE